MDRRQRKTRIAIFNAFSDLLSKKDFNHITVGEIIEKADVGRATFYSHFETKDFLLKEFCEDLFCHIFDTEKGNIKKDSYNPQVESSISPYTTGNGGSSICNNDSSIFNGDKSIYNSKFICDGDKSIYNSNNFTCNGDKSTPKSDEHHHIFNCNGADSVFMHLFLHFRENDNNIQTLLSSQNNELFFRYFRNNLEQLVDCHLSYFSRDKSEKIPLDFWKNHIISTFIETLKWWIKNGTKETPEEITAYFFAVL